LHGLEAGERWIRTFGTAEDAGVLAGLVISIAPTFPSREIRKRCHEAAFEISVASRGTDGSNLVPSSGESNKLRIGKLYATNPALDLAYRRAIRRRL